MWACALSIATVSAALPHWVQDREEVPWPPSALDWASAGVVVALLFLVPRLPFITHCKLRHIRMVEC